MSRLGMSAAPLILLLEDVWATLPQILLATSALVSGLASLLLSETLNERLPETIDDVEQPRSVENLVPHVRLGSEITSVVFGLVADQSFPVSVRNLREFYWSRPSSDQWKQHLTWCF